MWYVKCPFLYWEVGEQNYVKIELDFPSEMWFWYCLRHQAKVLANLDFGFSIGPKPKFGFGRTLLACKSAFRIDG